MNPRQKFLERALAVGLEVGTITPVDVVKHCNPEVLANHLPVELKAKLLSAALAAPKFDAALIVSTLGTEALAENMPMHVVWACIAECAARALGGAIGAIGAVAQKAVAATAAVKPNSSSNSSSSGDKSAAKPAPAAAVSKTTTTAPAKPVAKPAASKSAPGKPAAKGAAKPNGPKPRSIAAGTNRTRVPGSEFEVDTDVGADVVDGDWDDDIVEVVEEDVIGASTSVLDEIAAEGGVSDWSREEETVTRDVTKR